MNQITPSGLLPLYEKDEIDSVLSDDFQGFFDSNFVGIKTLEELQEDYTLENDTFFNEQKQNQDAALQDKAADFLGSQTGMNLNTVHVYGQILDVTNKKSTGQQKEKSIIKIIYQKDLKSLTKQSRDIQKLLKMQKDIIDQKPSNIPDLYNLNNLIYIKGLYRWDRLDYFNYDQNYYFVTVMQHMPNNLRDEIEMRKLKNKRFSHGEMLGLLKKCVTALKFLKQYGLNHCNIKATNILLDLTGSNKIVLLSDYGINHIYDLPLLKPQILEVFDSQYKKKTMLFFSPEKRQHFDKYQYNKSIDEELNELNKRLAEERKKFKQGVETQMLEKARKQGGGDKLSEEEEKKQIDLFDSFKKIKNLEKDLKSKAITETEFDKIKEDFEDKHAANVIKEVKKKIKFLKNKKISIPEDSDVDSDQEQAEKKENKPTSGEINKTIDLIKPTPKDQIDKTSNNKNKYNLDQEKTDIWALGMVTLQMAHLFQESNMEHLNQDTKESKIELKHYIELASNINLDQENDKKLVLFEKVLNKMLTFNKENRATLEDLDEDLKEYKEEFDFKRRMTKKSSELKWIDFEENIFLKIRFEYFSPYILAYFLWLLIADVLLMKLIGVIYLKSWYTDKLINIWGLCMIVIEFNSYLVLTVIYFLNMKNHGQTTEKAVFYQNILLLIYKTVECVVLLPSFGDPPYGFVIATYFLDLIAYFYYNIKLRRKSPKEILIMSLGILVSVGTIFLFLYEIVCWYYWANIINGESLGSEKSNTKNEGGTVTYEECVQKRLYQAFVYVNVFSLFFVGGKILVPILFAIYRFFTKYKFEIQRTKLTLRTLITLLQFTFTISLIVWGVLLTTQVDKCQIYQQVYLVKGNQTIILIMFVVNLIYWVGLIVVRIWLSNKIDTIQAKLDLLYQNAEAKQIDQNQETGKLDDNNDQKDKKIIDQKDENNTDQKDKNIKDQKEDKNNNDKNNNKEISLTKNQQPQQQQQNDNINNNNENVDYLDKVQEMIGKTETKSVPQTNAQNQGNAQKQEDKPIDIDELEQLAATDNNK